MLTDNRDFINSRIYVIESLISGVISVIFYVMIAKFLHLDDIGAYTLVLVYASILAAIANLGLVSGYERTYFEYTDNLTQKGKLLYSLQVFSFNSLIICCVLCAWLAEPFAIHLIGDVKYSKLWLITLCAVSISEFNKFYLVHLKNNKDAKVYAGLHLSQVILHLSLTYFFLKFFGPNVVFIGISYLTSQIIVLIWISVHQYRNLPQVYDKEAFKTVFFLSLPLTPRIFVGFIGTQFDKIILSQLTDLSAVGLYSVAQRLAMSIYVFMNALGRVWQPILYRELFNKGSNSDTGFLIFYMSISFVPALFLILFSHEAFLVFPETIHSGYQILVILCMHCVMLYILKITGQQLMFAKKTWLISSLSMFLVLSNIIITYPLVVLYGATGAALGTLLASFFNVIISYYYAQKYCYLRWNVKNIFYLYGYVLLAGVFILNFNQLVNTDYIKILVIKSFIFLGFLYFCHRYKILQFKSILRLFRS